LKKTLSFGEGGSGEEGRVPRQDLHPSRAITADTSSDRIVLTQENLLNESCLSYHFFPFNASVIQTILWLTPLYNKSQAANAYLCRNYVNVGDIW